MITSVFELAAATESVVGVGVSAMVPVPELTAAATTETLAVDVPYVELPA